MKNFLLLVSVFIFFVSRAQLPKVWAHYGDLQNIPVDFKYESSTPLFPDSIISKNSVKCVGFSLRRGLYQKIYFDTIGRITRKEHFDKTFFNKKLKGAIIYKYVQKNEELKKIQYILNENLDTASISTDKWKYFKLISRSLKIVF